MALLNRMLSADILSYYLVEKWPISTTSHQLHMPHAIVTSILTETGLLKIGATPRHRLIDTYLPFILQTLEKSPTLHTKLLYEMVCKQGYTGDFSHFCRLIKSLRPPFDQYEWMLAVLQKKITTEELKTQMSDLPELEAFLNQIYTGRLKDRNKSMAILSCQRGLTINTICNFLGISRRAYSDYKHRFTEGGYQALFIRKPSLLRSDDEMLKPSIFKVLHEPPSKYGINRTTWTMALIRKALSQNGKAPCPTVIRRITRKAGYRWRKARILLTSRAPAYSEKIDRIHSILTGLQPNEAFFSIDEYGPFAIKMYNGRKLLAPGEYLVIPQWQKPRGSLILTAALELSSNQITHFYSDKKNTTEMIKMLDILVDKYADRQKIYLSWDAGSWHISKLLNLQIEEHNNLCAKNGGGVIVETAPLPSGAQFLNVIESVFSGMSYAIIQNSNYPSIEDAKEAINSYFEERNLHFQENPKHAGNKIWGKEREPAIFSDSSNCKDPRYR